MRSFIFVCIFINVFIALSCSDASPGPEVDRTVPTTVVHNTHTSTSYSYSTSTVAAVNVQTTSLSGNYSESESSSKSLPGKSERSLTDSSPNATFTDGSFNDVTALSTNISDSTIYNTTITNSTISNSNITSASIVNSTIHNTTITSTTITNSTITEEDNGSTVNNNNTSQCPEMCSCPDYDAWAAYLVPYLRQQLGDAADKYTDYVLKLFLLQQFSTNAESPKSIIGTLFTRLAAMGDSQLTVTFWWIRHGITGCILLPNVTFYLDAAMEARLFPQVEFKEAQEKAQMLAKAQEDPTFNPAFQVIDAATEQRLRARQLYNISFVCRTGAKIVVTKESSLFRYGTWSTNNCEVITEDELTFNRNMSLIELSVVNGTALWLENITVTNKAQDMHSGHNKLSSGTNSSSSDISGSMERLTVFPNIREVKLVNTSLSVRQLGEVLVWFQKASTISLHNNSLEDFNCSELIPSPADWSALSLAFNGLKSVPVCTLRPSVVSLDLSHNAISDISVLQYPRYVPSLKLDELNLTDNYISDVGIFTDLNLTYLYLAGNQISHLNKLSFTRLAELSVLDLSRNHLHQLDPGSFKSLVHLQILDLSHNHLQHFDHSVSPMRLELAPLACNITLSFNRFSHPPFRSENYNPGMEIFVYAAGNPFACDCDMAIYTQATANSSLTASYLDRGDMRCVYPSDLAGLPLDDVAFNDTCPVVTDCPAGCTCTLFTVNATVTVDCSGVEHFQFPKTFPDTLLLRLELQSEWNTQTWTSLQDGEYLRRVISVNVSGRGMTRISEFLCEALPHAELLDLSSNRLTHLPDCFHSRPKQWPILELRLAHNPWSCDCDTVSLTSWLAGMMEGKEKERVRVSDAGHVWCSADTQPGVRVAEWDSSDCETINYLPWAVSLGIVFGLAIVLGPVLYIYRLQAMVTIHAHLHVRPFTRTHHFHEEDYDHEALVVHGASNTSVQWVLNTLLPRILATHHRFCVPERDFLLGSSVADAYATTVSRAKATVCLLSVEAARDEWWLYAFQLARGENARRPYTPLLMVLLEKVDVTQLPEEVQAFLKTNTYLSVEDNWFWKKLFYYLPDPPKMELL